MPEPSIRTDLARLRPTAGDANAGLWLDRFLPAQLVGKETLRDEHPHSAHIRSAAAIVEPNDYARFYARWRDGLARLPQYEHVKQGEAVARGRLVIGLGAEGVLENAITLHRTYGVPLLPGSALKGLAASYAHRRLADTTWRRPPLELSTEAPVSAHEVVFGSTRCAGYVNFFDALFVPGSGRSGRFPLTPDVLTVHHPNYYQNGDAPEAPADWDSPTPISFISATGRFLIVLAGPTDWVSTAYDILALALDELGVGGKTAAGYGRFSLDGLEAIRVRHNQPSAVAALPTQAQQFPEQASQRSEAPELARDSEPRAAKNTPSPVASTIPAVGDVVSGNLDGYFRGRGSPVRVKLNRVPANVIGVLPPEHARNRTSGGIRARVVERMEQEARGEVLLVLEPVKA